jgi:hypothetical protein
MYIRIKFEDIESDKTKETQELLFCSPNGTFLTSSKAHMVTSKEIQEIVGYSVVFWYLDINILNKHYYGVMDCLNGLLKYPGVGSVDILPIEGHHNNEKFDELNTIIIQYVHGV